MIGKVCIGSFHIFIDFIRRTSVFLNSVGLAIELHIIFSLKILFDVQGGIALSQARGIEAHLINQWMVKGRKKYSGK